MPYRVYERILNDEISFPSDFTDEDAKEIIKKLLNKCSEGRIVTSICEFKAHSWFKGIDWIKLLQKKIPAPYKPRVEADLDQEFLLSSQGLDEVIDGEMKKHFGMRRRLRAGITVEIERLWEEDAGSRNKLQSIPTASTVNS